MKLTNKVLAVLAASVVAAASFMGCGLSSENTNNAIEGDAASGKFSVNYVNDDSTDCRAYVASTVKHEGSLVKIQITEETDSSKSGVMGFIWELEQNKDKTRNFCIFGFRNNKGNPQYYISKYWNVSDINAANFGSDTVLTSAEQSNTAALAMAKPVEHVIKDFTSLSSYKSSIVNDGTYTVWVDIWPMNSDNVTLTNYGQTDKSSWTKVTDESQASYADKKAVLGSFIVEVYAGEDKPTYDASTGATPIAYAIIPPSILGYSGSEDVTAKTLAVYTNIYSKESGTGASGGTGTLKGSWDFSGLAYGADEVVEE